MTIITGEQIPFVQLLIIRGRLRLELKNPCFAKGPTAAVTMRAVKARWPHIKTRQKALEHLNSILADFDAQKNGAPQ